MSVIGSNYQGSSFNSFADLHFIISRIPWRVIILVPRPSCPSFTNNARERKRNLFTAIRFACDIDQSANIWIEFHLRSLPCALSRQLALKLIALFFAATPCWRDSTRSKQLSTVVILSFQFGLYHVVIALSCLRSYQPCFIIICPS